MPNLHMVPVPAHLSAFRTSSSVTSGGTKVSKALCSSHVTPGGDSRGCAGTEPLCLCPSQFCLRVCLFTSTQADPTAELPLWRKQCHVVPLLFSPLTKFAFRERVVSAFKRSIHSKRTCVLKQAIEPFITSLGDSSHEFFIFCRAHSRSATALCGCTHVKRLLIEIQL